MIKNLTLENFGRFSDKNFAFSDTVIFFGPNEAGKTTLYDALFSLLCNIPNRGDYKKYIYSRYEDRMQARLDYDGEQPAFDPDEFENLYAIRSGKVDLDIKGSKDWIQNVKTSLFSGGINPLELAVEMEKNASDDGKLKHNKDLAQNKKNLDEFRQKKDTLEQKRGEFSSREERNSSLKQELENIRCKISETEKEITRITGEITFQDKISKRKELNLVLKLLNNLEGRREKLKKLGKTAGVMEKIMHLDDEVIRLKNNDTALGSRIDGCKKRLAESEAAKNNLEIDIASARKNYPAAQALLDRLRNFQADISLRMKKRIFWNLPLLVSAGLLTAASIVMGILLNALFFLGCLTAFLAVFARMEKTEEDPEATTGILKRTIDDYRNRTGGELMSRTITGLSDELQKALSRHDTLAEKLNELTVEISRARKELAEGTTGLAKIQAETASLMTLKKAALDAAGAHSREDLAAMDRDFKNIRKEIEDFEMQVRKAVKASNSGDEAAFLADVRRRLAGLDSDGIPGEGISESELQKLKGALSRSQTGREELKRREQQITIDYEKNAGIVQYSLGDTLKELVLIEKKIEDGEAAVNDILLLKQAARTAAGIFRDISTDSDVMMEKLAQDLKANFSAIVPGLREVTVDNFALDSIQVSDKGGVQRPVEHLSRGTRDSFIFAARLTLAVKADPEKKKKLLVLDEPFYTLDAERTALAINMVRRIQDEDQWQVVLFTKDKSLADTAKSILKNPVVHDLLKE